MVSELRKYEAYRSAVKSVLIEVEINLNLKSYISNFKSHSPINGTGVNVVTNINK